MGIIINLHLRCASSCPTIFHLSPSNSHGVPEGRKLIESIYSKNNNYFLMDGVCRDDKTLALTQTCGFRMVVTSRKKS